MTPLENLATGRADMPAGTQDILNTRSLQTAHRRLAERLQPGLRVLDIGCGTGAITRGIAEAVAPDGDVVGMDINPMLIDEARRRHGDLPNLRFEMCDIYRLPSRSAFDVVHAARVLQWLARPLDALQAMAAAARPGRRVIVLDYNHEQMTWTPEPPRSMQTFYAAFLRWRAEAGMDNAIADHLPAMLARAGLEDIAETPQLELTQRSDPDFAVRLGIWAEVAATRGHQMVQDQVITETQRAAAETDYRTWIRDSAVSQNMYLCSVEGRRPRPA